MTGVASTSNHKVALLVEISFPWCKVGLLLVSVQPHISLFPLVCLGSLSAVILCKHSSIISNGIIYSFHSERFVYIFISSSILLSAVQSYPKKFRFSTLNFTECALRYYPYLNGVCQSW